MEMAARVKKILTLTMFFFLTTAFIVQAQCVDFEGLTVGTNYNVGNSLVESGVTVTGQPFVWSNGTSTSNGYAQVGNNLCAGGSGLELIVNNINLAFEFSAGLSGLSFLFGEYGGNLNIEINGDFQNFENFDDINGNIIGGVSVSVTNGLGNDTGTVTLSGTIISFSVGGQELCIDHVCPVSACDIALPDPVVSLVGTENYTVGGNDFVRYLLAVDNRDQYPDALFAPDSNLPPCGANANSSRTWCVIFDQDNNYIYGFCALASAEDLDGLWFSVPDGDSPPAGVYVVLWDRLCEENWQNGYKSSLIQIDTALFAPPPTADLEIQSKWAGTPPIIDGAASAGEWDDAGSLPLYDSNGLQRGTLFVKNDNTALYLLLDMTGDTLSGPDPDDDYSGIAFDIDLDSFKAPYVDLKYATAAGTENLGIQMAVTEEGWTGVTPTLQSLYQEGYGTSASSGDFHKLFEYKLVFDEIDINFEDILADQEQLFHARINVKVVSEIPGFSVYYPSSQYGSWENPMIRISLDLGSLVVGPDAPIFAGIGLVPISFIDQINGLATTGSGHQINVTDAPFGKHLRVMGNLDKLRGLGIQYYAIAYCNMGLHGCGSLSSGAFDLDEWNFLADTRTNYYWNSTEGRYVLDSVSPGAIYDDGSLIIKAYPVPSAALNWYMPNLLFDWRTTGTVPVGSGLYKVHFFGFASDELSSYVSTPASENTMVVRIDNTYPVMTVNSISHKGTEIDACGMVQLDSIVDTLLVNVSAYDPDAHLYNFSLYALYGDNQSFTCHSENYASYLADGGTGPEWQGAFPSANYVCTGDAGDHWETSCGYTFRVSGWDRAINGYGRIHYNAGHKTITVLMPGFTMP